MKTKRCNRCRKTKPVSEFYRMTASKDGYQYACKDCFGKTYRSSNYKRRRSNRAATTIKRTGRGKSARKTCTGCGRMRPLADFCRMAASPDGLAYECRSCRRERWLAYYADNVAWASLPTGERQAAKNGGAL